MNKRIITMLILTFLSISAVSTAQDEQLPLNPPPGYYGSLEVNGQPAPAGTVITAKVGGEERGSITITGSGFYGDDPGPAKLWIRAYQNETGTKVTFYVNGVAAGQTAELPGAGITNRADLTFTGVPVSTAQTGASGNSADSTGGSSSGGNGSGVSDGSASKEESTKGTAVPTSVIAQPEITPAATDALKVSGVQSATAQAIDPTAIIGAVTLLVAVVIVMSYFRRK